MGKSKQGGISVLVGQNGIAPKKGLQNQVGSTTSTKEEKEKVVVDIGLDISTAVVGICVLDASTGAMLHLSHKKLTKFDTEYEKADNFTNEWVSDKWIVRKIFIEEAAKKFSPGFSSADTIMTLGRFNGIISYMVYGWFGIKPAMVNVRSARSVLGIKINYKDKTKDTKTKVFEAVLARNPSFPWTKHLAKTGKSKGQVVWDKTNTDMADAWVISRGGQLINP